MRWYRASGPRATFGFCVTQGRVIESAPYGRRWLVGKTEEEALASLRRQGYSVSVFAETYPRETADA